MASVGTAPRVDSGGSAGGLVSGAACARRVLSGPARRGLVLPGGCRPGELLRGPSGRMAAVDDLKFRGERCAAVGAGWAAVQSRVCPVLCVTGVAAPCTGVLHWVSGRGGAERFVHQINVQSVSVWALRNTWLCFRCLSY